VVRRYGDRPAEEAGIANDQVAIHRARERLGMMPERFCVLVVREHKHMMNSAQIEKRPFKIHQVVTDGYSEVADIIGSEEP